MIKVLIEGAGGTEYGTTESARVGHSAHHEMKRLVPQGFLLLDPRGAFLSSICLGLRRNLEILAFATNTSSEEVHLQVDGV